MSQKSQESDGYIETNPNYDLAGDSQYESSTVIGQVPNDGYLSPQIQGDTLYAEPEGTFDKRFPDRYTINMPGTYNFQEKKPPCHKRPTVLIGFGAFIFMIIVLGLSTYAVVKEDKIDPSVDPEPVIMTTTTSTSFSPATSHPTFHPTFSPTPGIPTTSHPTTYHPSSSPSTKSPTTSHPTTTSPTTGIPTLGPTHHVTNGVPTGTVIWYAAVNPPPGYLICNGDSHYKVTYPELYDVIGEVFGGSILEFNVPNLLGEFIRGFDNNRGVDAGREFGSSQDHMLEDHNHTLDMIETGESGTHTGHQQWNTLSGFALTNSYGVSSGNVGNETRPRNVALLPCIKT